MWARVRAWVLIIDGIPAVGWDTYDGPTRWKRSRVTGRRGKGGGLRLDLIDP